MMTAMIRFDDKIMRSIIYPSSNYMNGKKNVLNEH
jgi:hypothetical protein